MTSPRYLIPLVLCISLAVLAGCSTPKKTGGSGSDVSTRGGGYYKDDGPGSNIPPDLQNIPNAVPKLETHSPANFRPYVVFGKKYYPVSDEKAFRQEGTASWYGRKFHGKKTANGEIYDMYAMSAAHPTLPIPSYARVTHAKTGKSVIVRVNDRGPFHSKRIIDVSYAAATKLGLVGPGSGQVIVEAITNADIRSNRLTASAQPKPAPVASLTVAQKAQDMPDALAAIASDTPIAPTPVASASQQAGVVESAAIPGQVYLQFGAFSASNTANSLAQRLNQQIGEVESRSAQVNKSNALHKVQIGPYPSRTAAVNAALRIREVTGLQPSYALQ